MLNRVCCIIDVDGFDIKREDESGRYTNEFLVRELGYIRVDPVHHYVAESYRFDLTRKVDLRRCSSRVRRTLDFQTYKIVGLTVWPGPNEHDAIEYERLESTVQNLYESCRQANADVVAYKGGDKERKLLASLNIPCVDLEGYGCYSYDDLVTTKAVYSELKDCGHHTEFVGHNLVHCPKAEVTAYRDWFMKNYERFS